MTAAIYARVSTEGQRDEETIESQIAEIKTRVAEDGNELLQDCVYCDDGYSGTILARPELDRLRDDAKKGVFNIVYVYDRGRLSRKFAYQEIVIEELHDTGVEFATLHDVAANTPEEQVLQAMQGVFQEYERVKISERFRRGKMYKVNSGKLLGYNSLYGYTYIPRTKTENGRFEISETEAGVVRLICQWVGEEHISIRDVIRRLLAEGIPPRENKRPIWTKGPVIRILREESYTGTHYYNKTEAVVTKNPTNKYRRIKKTGRINRPKEEWIPVQIPPIIPRELFDKVQVQLANNIKFARRNTRNDYLLQGIIYCACGSRRTAEGVNGHLYYRCTQRSLMFPLPNTCRSAGVNASVADVVTWNGLVSFLEGDDHLVDQAQLWLDERKSRTSSPVSEELSNIIRQEKKLLEEEERYSKAYGQDIMAFETYKLMMQDLDVRKKDLADSRARAKRASQAKEIEYPVTARELVDQVVVNLKQMKFASRQEKVRGLVNKVIADREQITVGVNLPLKESVCMELSHEDGHCWIAECGQIDPV